MELKVVNIWFQNKRQTTKRKMLEMGEISKGESPFESSREPARKQPMRQTAFRRPNFLNRRNGSFNSTASDAKEEDIKIDEDEDDEDAEEDSPKSRTRSLPAERTINIVSHMVSSSSESSSLGRKRAALLANFGPRNSRLEWVCAKNYAKFVSERRRQSSTETAANSSKECDCCAKLCDCSGSGSETEDEEHEAITPGSVVLPLPDICSKMGKLKPAIFWNSPTISSSISDLSAKDVEAARTLLDLASGP